MKFQEIINAAQFKISSGSEFLWPCYGGNARYLDFNSVFKDVTASCIFDTQNQTIYEVNLYLSDKAYRWVNPDYVQAMKDESFARNLDPRMYLDEQKYNDCDVYEDLLEKITTAFSTGTCSDDIVIALALSPEQEALFASLPQGTDLNKFILIALEEKVAEIRAENKFNWETVINNLSVKGIVLSVDNQDAPMLTSNMQDFQQEVESSGLKNINLQYSDRLTKDGMIYSLTSEIFIYTFKVKTQE